MNLMKPLRFQNPANGYVEEISHHIEASFWLGPIYFASKGIWLHVILQPLFVIGTLGVGLFIYPFFVPGIIKKHYLRKGWKVVDDAPPAPENPFAGFTQEELLRADERMARDVRGAASAEAMPRPAGQQFGRRHRQGE
jgi:hypothetical protein